MLKEDEIAERDREEFESERVNFIKGINSFNTILAELYHYLVNTVSAISSVQQLVEMDESYIPKLVEVTKFQMTKLTSMLEALSTLRGLINHNTRSYISEQEGYFKIEEAVRSFLKSIEKKNIS